MGNEVKPAGSVRHLDHFVVAVMDANRAEKFYTDVLGARTLKRQDTPNMTRVFMKLGDNHVGLFTQGKTTLPKRESAASYPRHSFLIPEAQYAELEKKIRAASLFVREIRSEKGLGCCWTEGIVFQDSEGNFWEIAPAKELTRPRVDHLHFDTTDPGESIGFYQNIMNFELLEQKNGIAVIGVPSNQRIILNQVDELSEVTRTNYRGRHFAFAVSDDDFHAIVEKLHRAGIDERDDHGEREGRRPEQLGTYFREPSGFRLQITNEDSATFAEHAND